MLGKFKINIAILICLTFVFRLLFVNISLLSASNIQQTNNLLSKYFSTTQKRKRNAETVVRSNATDYTVVEVCEEGLDNEEDLIKANSSVILSTFCSFLKRITSTPKLNRLFDLIKSDLYPKKYLALSTLRL
jgi:hypothetical protein